MPTPVNLRETSVRASYDVQLEWTFDANLSALPEGGYKSDAIKGVPLRGDWQFHMQQSAEDDDIIELKCSYGGLDYAALGLKVDVTVPLHWISDGRPLLLKQSHFGRKAVPDRPAVDSPTFTCYKGKVSKQRVLKDYLKESFASIQTYRLLIFLSHDPQPELPEGAAQPLTAHDNALSVVRE